MKLFPLIVLLAAAPACGEDAPAREVDADDVAETSDVPVVAHECRAWTAERAPLFGDLHVHTRLSLDANLQGTRLGPADAYRFAKGEEVGIQPHRADGTALRRLKLERPLDFAAVTDHDRGRRGHCQGSNARWESRPQKRSGRRQDKLGCQSTRRSVITWCASSTIRHRMCRRSRRFVRRSSPLGAPRGDRTWSARH